jgi:hypothetical protein
VIAIPAPAAKAVAAVKIDPAATNETTTDLPIEETVRGLSRAVPTDATIDRIANLGEIHLQLAAEILETETMAATIGAANPTLGTKQTGNLIPIRTNEPLYAVDP